MTTATAEQTEQAKKIYVLSLRSVRANIQHERDRVRNGELQARADNVVSAVIATAMDDDDYAETVRGLYLEFDKSGLDSIGSNGFWFERAPSAGHLWLGMHTPDGGTVYLANRPGSIFPAK